MEGLSRASKFGQELSVATDCYGVGYRNLHGAGSPPRGVYGGQEHHVAPDVVHGGNLHFAERIADRLRTRR